MRELINQVQHANDDESDSDVGDGARNVSAREQIPIPRKQNRGTTRQQYEDGHNDDYDYTPQAQFSARRQNLNLHHARRMQFEPNEDQEHEILEQTIPSRPSMRIPTPRPNRTRTHEHFPEQPRVLPQVQIPAQPQVQLQPIYIACPNAGQMENTWGDFDGNLTKWQTFHDCFKAAVHDNQTIAEVFKFQRLKASLKGKAANIFSGWEHTDANYDLAWERLKQIYQSKYQTSKQLFRKFINLPKLDHASGAMLENMSNVTHTVLSQLRSMSYPVQYYDAFFVHMLHDKLDSNTSKEWELHRTSETPRLSTMLDFIDWQAKALSNVQFGERREQKDNRKRTGQRLEHEQKEKRAKFKEEPSTGSSSKNEQKKCVLCKDEHYLHRCQKFKNMNLSSRRKCVRDHALCYNCLRSTHMVKDCTASECRRCNKKHNSLLCPENPNNLQVTAVQTVQKEQKVSVKKPKEKPKVDKTK